MVLVYDGQVAFPKFCVSPLDGFWEKEFYRLTTDARVTTVALLCSSTKQS